MRLQCSPNAAALHSRSCVFLKFRKQYIIRGDLIDDGVGIREFALIDDGCVALVLSCYGFFGVLLCCFVSFCVVRCCYLLFCCNFKCGWVFIGLVLAI
jgi:hypothetical protein